MHPLQLTGLNRVVVDGQEVRVPSQSVGGQTRWLAVLVKVVVHGWRETTGNALPGRVPLGSKEGAWVSIGRSPKSMDSE